VGSEQYLDAQLGQWSFLSTQLSAIVLACDEATFRLAISECIPEIFFESFFTCSDVFSVA